MDILVALVVPVPGPLQTLRVARGLLCHLSLMDSWTEGLVGGNKKKFQLCPCNQTIVPACWPYQCPH